MFELLLRRAPDLSIKCSSLVRSFNFATWELCLVDSYSGDKRVVYNILVRVRLDSSGGVVVVEAQTVLDELNDRAIRTMDADGSFNGRVHCDATELASFGEREDVGQRVWIVPDRPKILDVANKRRDLGAAICVNLHLAVAAPDVREEIRVFKNRNSRLPVEEYPGRWDEHVTRGQLSESEFRNLLVRVVIIGNNGLGVRGLEKRHGVSSFNLEEGSAGTVGALVSVMSFVLATKLSDAGVRDAVSASNHLARLHKSHAIFFLNCRLLAARVAARFFPLGRLEIDKQAVGCGQVDGILVVSSGEMVVEVNPKGAKTTTVGSLQESQSESAVKRNLEAFCWTRQRQ